MWIVIKTVFHRSYDGERSFITPSKYLNFTIDVGGGYV